MNTSNNHICCAVTHALRSSGCGHAFFKSLSSSHPKSSREPEVHPVHKPTSPAVPLPHWFRCLETSLGRHCLQHTLHTHTHTSTSLRAQQLLHTVSRDPGVFHNSFSTHGKFHLKKGFLTLSKRAPRNFFLSFFGGTLCLAPLKYHPFYFLQIFFLSLSLPSIPPTPLHSLQLVLCSALVPAH